MAARTFAASVLDWDVLSRPPHDLWLAFHQKLLAIRQRDIVPRLRDMPAGRAAFEMLGDRAFRANWPLADGSSLVLLANFHTEQAVGVPHRPGRVLFDTHAATAIDGEPDRQRLPPWSVLWGIAQDNPAA
jgi:hypothetical protein